MSPELAPIGLHLTADTHGNIVVHLSLASATDAVWVEQSDAGLVTVELGADEPCQVRFTGPQWALVDMLATALETVEQLDGPDIGRWLTLESPPPPGLPPPDVADLREAGPAPEPRAGKNQGQGVEAATTPRTFPGVRRQLVTVALVVLAAAVLLALALALARYGPPPASGPTV